MKLKANNPKLNYEINFFFCKNNLKGPNLNRTNIQN
jgi:hypothetical protein